MFKKLTVCLQIVLVALTLFGCALPSEEVAKRRIVFPPPPDTPRFEWLGTIQSEADFPKDKGEALMASILGEEKVDAFDGPIAVATDSSGRILVGDLYAQVVKIMDMEEHTIDIAGQEVSFRNVTDLAVDQADRVYVVDAKSRKVLVFSRDFEPLFTIGGEEVFEKPTHLAINQSLGRLYVVDPLASKVKVFGLSGEFLFEFGGRGRDPGNFNAPQGIAIDPNGRVLVADMLNARIQKFSAEGEFIETFGSRGTLKNQFETPKDLAFDSEGNLYVIDSRRPNFRVFNDRGELLLVVGGEQRSSHKLGFTLPVSIHVDSRDRVIIADLMNRRIAVWQYLSAGYLQQNPL